MNYRTALDRYTQRRLRPLGLITYGTSPYDSWATDGTSYAHNPGCGNGESGLDNGPTTEGVGCTNQSSQMLQDQYSAGQTGLYLMDTRAQIGLAKMIGREDSASELQVAPEVLPHFDGGRVKHDFACFAARTPHGVGVRVR